MNKKLVIKGASDTYRFKSGVQENIDFLSFRNKTFQMLKTWYGIDFEIQVPLVEYEGELILGRPTNSKEIKTVTEPKHEEGQNPAKNKPKGNCIIF